tara:strand:- start:305 stop:748 length:444 start_codon:yes stop_codon:yes gene_type:complete
MATKTFDAVILKDVYDGDTFKLMVDVGFKMFCEKGLRLGYMLDCAEVRQDWSDPNDHEKKVGIYTRDLVREHFPVGSKVVVLSEKQRMGKYGRIIGDVLFDRVWLSQLLRDNGLVVSENLSNMDKQIEWEKIYSRLVSEGKLQSEKP